MQKQDKNNKQSGKRAKLVFRGIRHVLWMALNLLAIIGLLLADCCVWIDPSKAFLPAVMGIGFRPLLWLNVLFALSWLFSHRKTWSLFSLAAIVLSIGSINVTYSHGSADTGDCAHHLKVMSYNTHQMQMNAKPEANDVLRYIRESGADVVMLQEYEVVKDRRYLTSEEARAYLLPTYPYTFYDFRIHDARRQFGIVIYSKYPLLHKQSIAYESRANQSAYCDVAVDGDTLRLINNHLESIGLTKQDLDFQDGEDVSASAEGVMEKMRSAYSRRVKEVPEVAETVRQSPYPVIVAGDLNDVPVSYTYHNIGRGLQDCFLVSSWLRTGNTYFRHHVGIRIDHIFVSKSLKVRSFETPHVDYSDHRPVMAEVAW